MNEHVYILIMAGGEGTRFYPLSTPERPKQFLSFWGDRTFIQQTYDRISGIVDDSHVFVATNKRYVGLVQSQLPNIPSANIVGEPEKKNTAPCIAFVAHQIALKDKEAVLIIVPSDHVITKEEEFKKVLERAAYIAKERDVLVTLGIQPTWEADCYGYIKKGKLIEDDPDGKWHAYTVDRFVEKPSITLAHQYIQEGDYLWNSGMFVWKVSVILGDIQDYLPKMNQLLKNYSETSDLDRFFKETDSISIDYGVMEHSKRVVTIPCHLDWSDVGTWKGLYHLCRHSQIALKPEVKRVMLEQIDTRPPSP